MARGIDRSRYVGTGDAAEDHRGLETCLAAGEIAAIDQNIAISRQGGADGRQLVEMFALHARRIERCIAKPQGAFSAVTDNMDRIHARATRKRRRNLLHTVARRIQEHNLRTGIERAENARNIANRSINEHDRLTCRGRPRSCCRIRQHNSCLRSMIGNMAKIGGHSVGSIVCHLLRSHHACRIKGDSLLQRPI